MMARRTSLAAAGASAVAATTGPAVAQGPPAVPVIATTTAGKVRGQLAEGIVVFTGIDYDRGLVPPRRIEDPRPDVFTLPRF